MNYLYLALAIVAEIAATMMLKATESFTRPVPSIVVLSCVGVSLFCFSLCVKSLNVAIVYALWSGIGICAVTCLGWLIYGQKMDSAALFGITLILIGVVIINLYSNTVEVPD